MRPIIFSGTTEGRLLSERLTGSGIPHIVCVATGYGELVMQTNEFADVRQGRLDEAAMEELISSEADKVFDATHPYAAAVSENIRKACSSSGTEYIRILRGGSSYGEDRNIRVFTDAAECAEALKRTSGSILLTTGSKELHIYAADPMVRRRLFARVLPSEESIRLCAESGITGRNVIALQGPFTREMDLAMIRQYGISVIVTKASGRAGGFEDKLAAAAEAGIPVFIIGRPSEETGISVNEAARRYFGIRPYIRIDLVGTGPGRDTLLTAEAADAISRADVIFGAPRMIRPYEGRTAYPYYLAKDIIPVISELKPDRAAVLFSGDTGFYSGAGGMKPALEAWLEENGFDHDICIHPGISSAAYLASKIGVQYSGAEMLSIHGRADDRKEVLHRIISSPESFVLLSGPEDVRILGNALEENLRGDCRIILGRQLSYPDETVISLTAAQCAEVTEPGLYIAYIRHGCSADKPLVPVIPDSGFIRGKVPMTKENIRHLSIIRLGLTENSILYDIGSGTGSVACEAARLSSSVKVYAVEMKEEACGLIAQNAEQFGLDNVEVIQGTAPEALAGLEPPTHVFIGGSSGRLRDILRALRNKNSRIRTVINAVSIETMAEIQSVVDDPDITDMIIEQISVSRSRELGNYHLMTAENPVMIASFVIGGAK